MLKIAILALLTLPAFAQKNMYEAKWGSQGNGGGSWTVLLIQPQTCVSIPLGAPMAEGRGKVCVAGAHGNLHVMDFGTGPFLIDDQGYVFTVWSNMWIRGDDAGVRTFENGVH